MRIQVLRAAAVNSGNSTKNAGTTTMTRTAKQIAAALSRRNGWTRDYTEAFIAGAVFRIRHRQPPRIALVARDAYSKAFRAGFLDSAHHAAGR